MKGFLLYLHALTPVHSGTGQSVAVIDLPIAREKATGWPVIPGSTLKGVVRDLHRTEKDRQDGDGDEIKAVFGDQDKSGDVALGDQRILFLAVRSYFGTFAYLTCPAVLRRLNRDRNALTPSAGLDFGVDPTGQEVAVGPRSVLAHGAPKKVYLEDIDLDVKGEIKALEALARELFESKADQDAFIQRVAVVSDDVFSYFCETGTEVAARVRLNQDSKTVAQGGLWYEEAVPAESIFFGPVIPLRGTKGLAEVKSKLQQTPLIQIGGDSTVGRGLCRVVVQEVA